MTQVNLSAGSATGLTTGHHTMAKPRRAYRTKLINTASNQRLITRSDKIGVDRTRFDTLALDLRFQSSNPILKYHLEEEKKLRQLKQHDRRKWRQ